MAQIVRVTVAFFVLIGTARPADGPELILPRDCLTKVELMPETECHGKDLDDLYCAHLKLTYKKGCERWKAK